MPKALVIVESPVKAKTINKYLGKQYIVKASLGHIKDLPKKDLAVDVEHGIVFVPTGSAVSDFYGGTRVGDDLFADTLLALDASTGMRLMDMAIQSLLDSKQISGKDAYNKAINKSRFEQYREAS